MGDNNSNFALIALVAIVAIVGIVVMLLMKGSAGVGSVMTPSYGNSMMSDRGNVAGQMSSYCAGLINNMIGTAQMAIDGNIEPGTSAHQQLSEELLIQQTLFEHDCL